MRGKTLSKTCPRCFFLSKMSPPKSSFPSFPRPRAQYPTEKDPLTGAPSWKT